MITLTLFLMGSAKIMIVSSLLLLPESIIVEEIEALLLAQEECFQKHRFQEQQIVQANVLSTASNS